MIFNSYDFLLFALVFFSLFFFLPKKLKLPFLLVSSYFFYGWWNIKYLALILISTVIDYTVARKIEVTEDEKNKKRLLWVSMTANLGILATFKYFNFFLESFYNLFTYMGLGASLYYLDVLLPIGISFYTFQTLGYTIDVYKGKIKAEQNFIKFAVFVSYFPQLVAGPIERAKNLLPQFDGNFRPTEKQVREGIWLVIWGYFLKVVVADNLASVVSDTYQSTKDPTGFVWIATLAFIIQIYGDFAGYSKIARGISKFLGIDLIQNFQQPYLATSVSDLWRRWHMSLSVWANDYIFFPFVFNHKDKIALGLIITFLVIGVWHGANWTFFVFGLWHGCIMALERLTLKKRNKFKKKFGYYGKMSFKVGGWLFAMFVWMVGCIFFRSQTVGQGFAFLQEFLRFDFSGLSTSASVKINFFWTIVFLLIILLQNAWCIYKKDEYSLSFLRGYHWLILIGFMGTIYLFGAQTEDFIYFQF